MAKSQDRAPRILIVDDDANIRRAIFHVLKSEYDVTMVESGNKAIEILRNDMDFDVVSLDLQMPGISGIETLKIIKHLNPTTEVLIVTAHSDVESAKGALKFGAYEYLDKPFGNHELRKAIRKGVERRRNNLGAEKAIKQLEFVKAQLIQSEKFSEIGKLIAGVAHELNNPLAAILGFAEIPLMTQCPPEDTRDYFEKIKKSALLCKNIIEKLLAFSRKKDSKRERLHINSIIETTLELKQRDLKMDSIEVVKQLAEDIPYTMADFYGLQQVFLNMINNAHQAMKKGMDKGTIIVKSECDGKMIRVSFRDTGPGIPKENLQKIFEPLFTTKGRGEGTGLGLSICYEIIEDHGGTILVASEEGEGACFIIEIPVVAEDNQMVQKVPSEDQGPDGLHILVLDAREEECNLLKDMIVSLGHSIDMATDVFTAQGKIQSGTYDIIFSNLDMPDLNGRQVYEYTKRFKPESINRIMYIVDGIVPEEMKLFLNQKKIPCLVKPFRIQDIREAINDFMGAGALDRPQDER